MPMNNQNNDKIFIEKKEKFRFLIQHPIGIGRLIEKLKEKFKVETLRGDDETIILVEEKEEED